MQIFEKDDDDNCGSLIKTAVGNLNNVADGEVFTLPMGTSTDVKVRRRLVDKQIGVLTACVDVQPAETQDGNNGQTKTKTTTKEQWEVTIFNASDKVVTVKVEDNFVNNFSVLSGELTRNGVTGAFLKVTAPAKGEQTVTYTVRIDELANK